MIGELERAGLVAVTGIIVFVVFFFINSGYFTEKNSLCDNLCKDNGYFEGKVAPDEVEDCHCRKQVDTQTYEHVFINFEEDG